LLTRGIMYAIKNTLVINFRGKNDRTLFTPGNVQNLDR
jgi:hypothetical protein